MNVHTKYIHLIICGTGGKIWATSKCIFFTIRRLVIGPGACLYIRISAMMHHVHTGEAVVTTQKIDIFLLVTTRLIAHSGQS